MYLWFEIIPAEKLAEGKRIVFGGKLSLEISVKPDPRKNGNTGIATRLATGAELARCYKGKEPITAGVRITNEQGKTIHSEDVSLDKLAFG